MDRILEPELMEDDDQVCAYAEADFEEPHSNFISLFQNLFGQRDISGYALDLGCGAGDISIRFARAFQNCIVHGVDGSKAMIMYGRKILERTDDVRSRVELIHSVLSEVVLPYKKYDVIISNSLLHHLHNPKVLWETIKQYADSETPIFIMDLKRVKSAEEAKKLVEIYAANEPVVLQRDFYNSLLAAFEMKEIIEQLKDAELDDLSVKVVTDRHVLISGYIT